MDRGAWQATVHGVTKNQTWLSTEHFHYPLYGSSFNQGSISGYLDCFATINSSVMNFHVGELGELIRLFWEDALLEAKLLKQKAEILEALWNKIAYTKY